MRRSKEYVRMNKPRVPECIARFLRVAQLGDTEWKGKCAELSLWDEGWLRNLRLPQVVNMTGRESIKRITYIKRIASERTVGVCEYGEESQMAVNRVPPEAWSAVTPSSEPWRLEERFFPGMCGSASFVPWCVLLPSVPFEFVSHVPVHWESSISLQVKVGNI